MGDTTATADKTSAQPPDSWMYNSGYNNTNPYGMYNPAYAQYYSQYYSQMAQMQQQSQNNNQSSSETTTTNATSNAPPGFSNSLIGNKMDENPTMPPLPPGPPPTLNFTAGATQSPGHLISKPAFFNSNQNNKQSPSQFGQIRFNLNPMQKRPLQHNNPLMQTQNLNGGNLQINQNTNSQAGGGGGGKKKRKRNKNQQNKNNNCNFDMSIPPPPPQVPVAQLKPPTPPPPTITPLILPTIDLSKPPPPFPANLTYKPDSSSAPSPKSILTTKKPDLFHNPPDAWPDSLNNYVTRCYAKCKTDFDKDQVGICLKGRITAAANKGELWTKDWDSEPIPSVHSERNSILLKKRPPVTGSLSQFQNLSPSSKQVNVTAAAAAADLKCNKKGISNSLGARLGIKGSNQRRSSDSKSRSRSPSLKYNSSTNRRRTRSRSDTRSPRRKLRKSSTSSSDDNSFISLNTSSSSAKGKTATKMFDRLGGGGAAAGGLNSNKKSKKQKQNAKKAAFFTEHGVIGGKVDGDEERLQQRAARFNNIQKKNVSRVASSAPNNQKKKKYQMPTQNRLFIDDSIDGNNYLDLTDFHIVGTLRDLEKSFLRLTKAPASHEVRPVDVLIHSLENVKKKWVAKQDYFYACDQLKSIRQDLTVIFFFLLNFNFF